MLPYLSLIPLITQEQFFNFLEGYKALSDLHRLLCPSLTQFFIFILFPYYYISYSVAISFIFSAWLVVQSAASRAATRQSPWPRSTAAVRRARPASIPAAASAQPLTATRAPSRIRPRPSTAKWPPGHVARSTKWRPCHWTTTAPEQTRTKSTQ